MYNSTNVDAFCEVLVKRRRGTPETVKMVLSILAGMVVSIFIFMFIPMFFILIVGMGTDCIRDQNAEKGI